MSPNQNQSKKEMWISMRSTLLERVWWFHWQEHDIMLDLCKCWGPVPEIEMRRLRPSRKQPASNRRKLYFTSSTEWSNYYLVERKKRGIAWVNLCLTTTLRSCGSYFSELVLVSSWFQMAGIICQKSFAETFARKVRIIYSFRNRRKPV